MELLGFKPGTAVGDVGGNLLPPCEAIGVVHLGILPSFAYAAPWPWVPT